MGRSNSEAPTALSSFAVRENQDGGNRNYLSAVLNSVKQKATGLRWPQLDSVSEVMDPPLSSSSATGIRWPQIDSASELMAPSSSSSSVLAASGGIATTQVGSEVEELPLSSTVLDVHFDEDDTTSGSIIHDSTSSMDNFEEFRFEQEAKLKQWLEGFDKHEAPDEKILDKHEAQAEQLP